MRIDLKAELAALALALAVVLTISLALPAAQTAPDSVEVSALLAEAKREAVQLRLDTEEMETFTRS